MDPVTALSLVHTTVNLTSSCIKVCRKYVGPSKYSEKDMKEISEDLWVFNGSLRNLETHYGIYEEDQAGSNAFTIDRRTSITSPVKKFFIGARFDTAFEKHLKCLKDSRILFHHLLQVDQTNAMLAVKSFLRNFTKNFQDLQNSIGEIDGRSRRDFEQVRGSLDNVQDTQKVIQQSQEDSRAREEGQARADKDLKIIDWLSNLKFQAKQSDVLSRRSGSTCNWILETEEFKNWTIGSGKTLWCTGIPGAGKTVFTSIVVDHLESIVAEVSISCVYFSYKDEAKQTPANLIASILQQILTKTKIVSDDIRALYEHHNPNNTMPTVAELSVQLQAYVRNLEKFFIVIDALDECSVVTRNEFLNRMRDLQPAVNLMITTRPAIHIENGFPEAACVEIRAKDTDIQSYCEEKFRSDRRLILTVQDDADLKDLVINTIAKNAQKMFLLAVLHMESLASHLNKAQVRNALDKLPKELDDTYDEALQRIASQGQPSLEMAYRVLFWISYAYRPLTVEELQCALAVTPNRSTFDKNAVTLEGTLVSICAGLVAVDPQSRIIRLVHYTTQEFLKKIRDDKFPRAPADITRTCLTYLSFDHARYDNTQIYNVQKSPFLSYAVQHWRDHMRASPDPEFDELTLQILSQPKKVHCIFRTMDEPPLNVGMYRDTTVPPLCAAAFLGLESVVLLLLERSADLIESETSNGSTALCIAVHFAQMKMIKVLLDHGASLESRDRQGCTPLLATVSVACLISEETAVAAARLLLDQGANINVQGKAFQNGQKTTTLVEAARCGLVHMVELLVEYDADVNLRGHDGLTALHLAHPRKHSIFKLLVGRGADLNARDKHEESTLARVSGHSSEEAEETVELLLGLGADIDSQNFLGETALFRAAKQGYCRIIRVLKEHGANIRALTKSGESVLLSAVVSNNRRLGKVVPLLLELGADVHSPDSAGHTALAAAAVRGLSDAVKLILDYKPYIDTSNRDGDTALTLAAVAGATLEGRSQAYDKRGHRLDDRIRLAAAMQRDSTTIELLLTNGASADLQNKAGNTALVLAAAEAKPEAVRVLLEHWPNADTSNGAGETALTLAAGAPVRLAWSICYDEKYGLIGEAIPMATVMERNLETIKHLLNYGASVDLKNKAGDTALTLAAVTGKLDATKLLHEYGANINTRNGAGDTALTLTLAGFVATIDQKAAKFLEAADLERKMGILQFLLDHRASVDLMNKAGNTAPTLAAATGNLKATRLLQKHGANINTSNRAGNTALILAAAEGRLDLVKFLLDHKANINTSNGAGNTALIVAAAEGRLSSAKLLLEHGADAHAMNKKGCTALSLTAYWGKEKVHRLLLEHLSEPNQPPVGSDAELRASMEAMASTLPSLTKFRHEIYGPGRNIDHGCY
ncbi:hypothetical protein JMJ35_009855 [Cladonia borealis]|uniref:Ankyrin repeat protein n=1 Tax=Cladonia borealis TaxID=184061 RepID=A0AA39QU85_9LECA|nr:hypothetical protein JMJ35_009855 [Cladonia borealis]